MFANIELPPMKAVVSTAASMAATAMFVRSFAKDIVPPELQRYLFERFGSFMAAFSNEMSVTVDEYEGLNKNQLFYAAQIYVSSIASPSTRRLRVSLPEKEKNIRVTVGSREEIIDVFHGIQLKWRVATEKNKSRRTPYQDDYMSYTESRYFVLSFHRKHKNRVIDEYLPYVLEKSKAVKEGKKTLKLHTLNNVRSHGMRGGSPWLSVNLDHPSHFRTLVTDDETKNMVIDDLNMFLQRKELYRKVGKAWKRGYLLFGPPGTGKSSLIAAMANYLNFDVYDLELNDIRGNSDLRRLLISTENRSIIVVEDIDASIDLHLTERKIAEQNRQHRMHAYRQFQGSKVTLPGVLNFIDGLWSSCGDERIIIFTTNHKEKLDPALLRPGRMDVHIHMSFCTSSGFKTLASNYLGINEHPLMLEAEGLIGSTRVTPAEVGEQLLRSDDPEIALKGLVKFLQEKKDVEKIGGTTEDKNKNTDANTAGLKNLMKMIRENEDNNALKILIRLLGEESGIQSVKDSGTSLESATGKENEIETK